MAASFGVFQRLITQRRALVAAIGLAYAALVALQTPPAAAFGGVDAVGQALHGGSGARPGGGGIALDCPTGQFVVGFSGRSGAWIDALGVWCAPKIGNGFGPLAVAKEIPMQGKLDGGAAFTGNAIMCPQGKAVDAMTWNMTRDPNGGHVDDILFACRGPEDPDPMGSRDQRPEIRIYTDEPGDFEIMDADQVFTSECWDDGNFATGIHIRASGSVEALDVDCSSLNKTSSPLSAAVALPAAPVGAMSGVDRRGNDYHSYPTNEPIDCQAKCQGDTTCKAWSWAAAGTNGVGPATCYMKRPAPAGVTSSCCISGLSTSLPPAPAGAKAGSDRPGSDYFSFISNDPANCALSCSKDAKCKAWTWAVATTHGNPQPTCNLKTAVPNEVANGCCVSGLTEHINAAAALKQITSPPSCPPGMYLAGNECRRLNLKIIPHASSQK